MRKYLRLLSALLVAFLMPVTALAVNFPNPANGFFVDLSSVGKSNTFADLLLYFVELALGIVGILSIAFIVYGGFQYITSRGSDEQAETGKKTLTNAIIGLVIVILSYVIVTVTINALQGKV